MDHGPNPIALAIPLFFLFIGVELWVARRRRVKAYHFADAITDLSCGVTEQVVGIFPAAAVVALYVYVYDHWRLIHFSSSSLVMWAIAILGVDVLYYWWHRLSHTVNFMWAVHVVHHSSEDFNLAVALRQAVLTDLTQTWFYLPLALAGVAPVAVFTVLSLSTLYQFWIHTELIGKLGPLDRWINTPSAHRVHHGVNPQYLDRNYAAVFMFWDRMFGSYEPEGEPCVYGISKPIHSFNPLWAQFHFWVEMGRMARGAPSLWAGLQVFFRSPGWQPPWLPVKPPSLPKPLTPQTFIKYDVPARPALQWYVGIQFALAVFATFALLMWGDQLGLRSAVAVAVFTLASLSAWGALLEAKSWGPALERVRLVGGCLICAACLWWAGKPLYWAAPAIAAALGSILWLARSGASAPAAQPA